MMQSQLERPNAEDVNYWKTSRSSPDTWMDKTKRQIEQLGGQVLMEGFGNEPVTGRAAFMLAFEIGSDRFKVIWPVLPSKSGNEKAARIQWEHALPFSHFYYSLMAGQLLRCPRQNWYRPYQDYSRLQCRS